MHRGSYFKFGALKPIKVDLIEYLQYEPFKGMGNDFT